MLRLQEKVFKTENGMKDDGLQGYKTPSTSSRAQCKLQRF